MKVFSALLLLICLFTTNILLAQKTEYSAFGAPVVKYTKLINQSSVILGGRFGWMINKSIVLGGAYYALANNVKTGMIDPKSGEDVLLGFTYGGLELEYVMFSEAPVHASVDMLFAGGGVTFEVPNKNIPHTNYFSQDLLVWEPEINLEFKVVKWFHIAAGAAYRMISSYKGYYGVGPNDLRGMSAVLTFKLGAY